MSLSKYLYKLQSLPGKLIEISGLSNQESEVLFYASIFLLFIIGLGVIIVLLQPIKGIFFLMMLGVGLIGINQVV